MKRLLSLCLLALALVSTAGAQTAEEIIRRHIDAVGGEDAWRAVEDQHAKLSVSVELPQGVIVLDVEVWNIYPGYVLARQNAVSVPDGFPDVSSAAYITPEGGWSESMQGRQEWGPDDVPSSAGAGLPSVNNPLDELDILAAMDTVKVEVAEQEEIKGRMAHVLLVGNENPTKRYYDVESGLLVATEAQMGPMGMALMHISEYQDFDGLKVALIQEGRIEAGGQTMSQTLATTEFHTNTGLTPEQLAELADSPGDN